MYLVDPKGTQLMHKQIYQPGSLRLVSNNNNGICEAGVKAINDFHYSTHNLYRVYTHNNIRNHKIVGH